MRFWNGVVMYAPKPPDYYAIPALEQCIFRLMQHHGDTQAWNLYWLTQPQTDLIPLHRNDWHRYYDSFNVEQTRAFYDALDTVVYNHLTLATLVAQPPREAMRLVRLAHLERTRFYHLVGGEAWRTLILGRLFLADRISELRTAKDMPCEVIDLHRERTMRGGSSGHGTPTKRPA